MTRLWARVEGHNHLMGIIQIIGKNIIIGIKIFIIVRGSKSLSGRNRGSGPWLQVKRGLHLLRKLKMLRAA